MMRWGANKTKPGHQNLPLIQNAISYLLEQRMSDYVNFTQLNSFVSDTFLIVQTSEAHTKTQNVCMCARLFFF